MNVMTTRMFTHTGPRRGDVFSESTFAKQIAMIEVGLQEPKIYVGNLESLRTYADVRDAVRAYYMLLTINPIKGEYYNIGGDYTCKIGDVLNYFINKSTVKNIEIVNKAGTNLGYSQFGYDIQGATVSNIIYPSIDPSIFEVKYPNSDIIGRVVTF